MKKSLLILSLMFLFCVSTVSSLDIDPLFGEELNASDGGWQEYQVGLNEKLEESGFFSLIDRILKKLDYLFYQVFGEFFGLVSMKFWLVVICWFLVALVFGDLLNFALNSLLNSGVKLGNLVFFAGAIVSFVLARLNVFDFLSEKILEAVFFFDIFIVRVLILIGFIVGFVLFYFIGKILSYNLSKSGERVAKAQAQKDRRTLRILLKEAFSK
jgi:uncharacterized membrane protein